MDETNQNNEGFQEYPDQFDEDINAEVDEALVSAVVEKTQTDFVDGEDTEDINQAVRESNDPDPELEILNFEPGTGSDPARDIEAILFISPEPVPLETLAEVTGSEGEELAHAVEAVRQKFSGAGAGIVFAEVAGGYTFRTADQARGAVERFCERPVDYSLSPAAMETLAIVAYLQPVTRPEIARIRGVGADTVVGTLVDKGLLAEAGRHEETGAIRYRTTAVFEKLFGLPDLASLPPIDGFEASPEDVEELREKLYLAAEKRQ